MTIYRVGQVWERGGLRRESVDIRTGPNGPYHTSTEGLSSYEIWWRRTGLMARSGWCWGSSWRYWAKSAKLGIKS